MPALRVKPGAPAPPRRQRIALIAHDNRKPDLLEWARYNRLLLKQHDLLGTGTTGKLITTSSGCPSGEWRAALWVATSK